MVAQEKGRTFMIALVTGASRGIGAAIARQLAAQGHTVLAHCCRNRERAEQLAAEIGGAVYVADIGSTAEIDRMAEEILRTYGGVDILVNNAGIALEGLYQSVSDGDVRRLFAVNIEGAMHCTKRLLPAMIAKHYGRIINISSVWGEVGAACEVHYSATKAAIIGFTKALAKEVAPSGITVNCVAPGVIDTDMNRIYDAETMAQLAAETPVGRIGTPEEVADAVCFFAGKNAGFITAQVLGVNGGFGI